jgi:hypothetical protein
MFILYIKPVLISQNWLQNQLYPLVITGYYNHSFNFKILFWHKIKVKSTCTTIENSLFSNRFSDRKNSVVKATDLETFILSVRVNKYSVAK